MSGATEQSSKLEYANVRERGQRPRRLGRGSLHTLHAKTLLIIVVTLLGLLVLLYLPLRYILFQSFLRLEDQSVRTNIQRAVGALSESMAGLEAVTVDYAHWDDTYAFVVDSNQEYISATLADSTFANTQLNLLLIANAEGQVIFGKGFDLGQEREVPLPGRLSGSALTGDPLLAHPDNASRITGLLLLPEGPLLISSVPILTSERQGPSRGTLIMGRFLGEAEIQRLAETTQLSIAIHRLDDPALPADVQQAQGLLSASEPVLTSPLNDERVAGYTLLNDISGRPALTMRIDMARSIYNQGRASISLFVIALLVAGIVFASVIVLLLQHFVLSRMARIGASVAQIGSSGDLSTREPVSGDDELTQLGDSINTMLESLDHAQSERWQAEQARAQMQEEIIRSKEQLTQMIIHDLKNPLTAIAGYLDVLRLTELSEDQRLLIDGARRSSDSMRSLISDILDIARIEEGRVDVRAKPTDLVGLLRACADELRIWAEQTQDQIDVKVDLDLPAAQVDEGLIRRVLINLLSNAIKHTPNGTVITLSADADDSGLRLRVRDSGPGIPAEQQSHLFERFKPGDTAAEKQTSSGLGLAFCKLAVEAHGGSIGVDSAPGQGTCFTITLPPELILEPALVER